MLAAHPAVDAGRIGLTGISWGGYMTCVVAGVDPRYRFAVPVYGCGFLALNSAWSNSGPGSSTQAALDLRTEVSTRYSGCIAIANSWTTLLNAAKNNVTWARTLLATPALMWIFVLLQAGRQWDARWDPRHYLPHAGRSATQLLWVNGTNVRVLRVVEIDRDCWIVFRSLFFGNLGIWWQFEMIGCLTCPMFPRLLISGPLLGLPQDFAYPLDSMQKSYMAHHAAMVKYVDAAGSAVPRLCVRVEMPHSHAAGWAPKEIFAFADEILGFNNANESVGGLPVVTEFSTIPGANGVTKLRCVVETVGTENDLSEVELAFSRALGYWPDRRYNRFPVPKQEWKRLPANGETLQTNTG